MTDAVADALPAAMKASPGASTAELAAILGVGQGSVLRRCIALSERGLIEKRRDRCWIIAAASTSAGDRGGGAAR